MTDREKWQEIVQKIEALKETQPVAYQMWQSIYGGLKSQIEQALSESERKNTEVHTGGIN